MKGVDLDHNDDRKSGKEDKEMHVLLADDHELVRNGLKFYLERLASKVTVIEAATFDEALVNSSKAPQLDLIILDLKMPGMNGFAGLELMRERFPKVPAVILSGSVRRGDVLTALAAGAAGYIPKTLSGKAMFNALQLILSGETYVPSIVLPDRDSPAGQPDADKGAPATGDNALSKLTPRERDALALLTQGYSNKEIARRLEIEEITVKVHLSGVYRKLHATNRTQAVRIAMQLGWAA